MIIEYKITEAILNNIYNFSNLHGRLYSIDKLHPWFKKLEDIIEERSGIAATTIDRNLQIQVNKYQQPSNNDLEYINYVKAKSKVERVFNSFDKLTVSKVKEIASILHGKKIETLRHNKQVLPKIVKQNNIYKTVELNIQTKPDEINNELIKYFRWLKTNIFTINPVILAAISHLKLVEIHPLEDGNGRLARIFEHGLLYLNGIDPNNIIPIEEFYLNSKDRYYDLLEQNIGKNDITTWIDYYCEGINSSIISTAEILKFISGNTMDILNRKITDLTDKEIEVVNIILNETQCSGAEIARRLNVSRQNINIIVKRLTSKNVIKKIGKGSSSRYTIR